MTRIFTALLFFTAMGAQAASVTIDFQEPISFTDQGGIGSPVVQSQFQSKGYLFTAVAYSSWTPNFDPAILQLENDRYFYMYDQPGGSGGCACANSSLRMEREDGGAFAVESADIDAIANFYSIEQATGVTGSGASVQLSLNNIGSGDWLNLRSFVISISSADQYSITADDIVVSAVPIPAAAWLFGSALAGLGWLSRRRKT